MLLGGHVTLSALIGALRPFTHVRFFRRICQHSQPFPLRTAAYIVGAEPFPGLIKAKRVFQFRVIERVQHINMLGQHYQPVSLLRVIDDGPSTLAPTNILSGCVFFLLNWELCSSDSDLFDVDDEVPGKLGGFL